MKEIQLFDKNPKITWMTLKINSSLFWGSVVIDTNKEIVCISNLDKKSLDEIETMVNRIITEDKQRLREKKAQEEIKKEEEQDESKEK